VKHDDSLIDSVFSRPYKRSLL